MTDACSLALLVKSLEQEVKDLKLGSENQQEASTLNGLLAAAIKSRDTYQADYLSANRERTRLQQQVDAYKKSVGASGCDGNFGRVLMLTVQMLGRAIESTPCVDDSDPA